LWEFPKCGTLALLSRRLGFFSDLGQGHFRVVLHPLQDKKGLLLMAKKPRHILGYLNDPNTWDKAAFETAIRAEVEASTGTLTASDELLVGSLVLTVDSLLTAEINIRERGHVTVYGNNEGVTAWYKIRTEMADKAVKMLAELGLVARGRPKLKAKVSDVDELFATA